MEEEFWQKRWRENQIGFHEGQPNDLLVAHFASLGLKKGSRVFVPLCGKAVDLDWLVGQGFKVVGVEFNQQAIQEVFTRLGLEPVISQQGPLGHFAADGIDLFVGDVFALTPGMLGPVDAIYDRAALVALPHESRVRYAQHMVSITQIAPQLAITFDYEQEHMTGPPFSVPAADIRSLYQEAYEIVSVATRPVEGPIAQRVEADEAAWVLTRR